MFPRRCAKRSGSCWKKMRDRIALWILRKVVNDMAVIYATLIIKGRKTFADVPDTLKAQVRQILIDLDVPELAD